MEITVEGWNRNHGTKRIASRSVLKAKAGGAIGPSEIGVNVVVTDPKTPAENKVNIYFQTKLLGSSEYLANVYLSFEELDRLYALALTRREAGEAAKSLAQHI